MRVLKRCTLVLAAWAAVGCGSVFRGSPDPVSDRDADVQALQQSFSPDNMLKCYADQSDACRSRIVHARRAAEDIRFSEFEEAVFHQGRTSGFASTLGILGLTTVSAATNGSAAKAFAGAAALLTGGREAYEKDVLAQKTLQALFAGMHANRSTVELRIRTGLAEPWTVYPLETAISDLEAYHRAGTVQGGLDTVTQAANVRGEQAQQDIRALDQRVKFNLDGAAKLLRKLICQSTDCSAVDEAEVARMKANCWPQAGVPLASRLSDLMTQAAFATQRVQIANCMISNLK